MIPELRRRFNSEFTPEKYERLLRGLEQATGTTILFRQCETPVFLPRELLNRMETCAREILSQLDNANYLKASDRAIPDLYNVPNEGSHPDFIQVDFAITRDSAGRLTPRLIELQGCASLYAFQYLLPREFQKIYDLAGLGYLLSGLNDESYLELIGKIILNGHAPEQVILMEIDPLDQKTLPDFRYTEMLYGVPVVDVSEVIKHGNRLYYRRDNREIEIRRIYNRVIIDEFVKKNVPVNFDFRDELDVEWAGHPNWYFRLSKFSLPFLDHWAVPRTWFLDQLDKYPDDLENFVLKPLFSFAGAGVLVEVNRAELDAVPADQRHNYVLQEKVEYAPAVETPDIPSKVEIRLMFVRPQGGAGPVPVTTLTRMSKGAMMGVDFNKDLDWVGSSCAFYPVV